MVRSSSHGATGADAGSAAEEAGRVAPTETAPELLPFADAFVPQFEEVRAVLDRLTGFALVPVEVPSRDVAGGLAGYLALTGRRIHVVGSDTEWRMLPAAIVAQPPGPEGIALVLEPARIDSDVSAALRLLNQRRDTVAERLGAPLLWCGSADFFRATAELAPDLWSVRELSLKIVVPPGFPSSIGLPGLSSQENQSGARAGPSASRMDEKDIDALREGLFSSTTLDEQHLYARLLLRIASLIAPVDPRTMERVVEVFRETTDSRDLARALEVVGHRAAERSDGATAEVNLREAHGLFGQVSDRAGKARCARALGRTLGASHRTAEAENWFGEALGLAREMDDWQEEAESARELALLRLQSGAAAEAPALLDIAHRRFTQLHDVRGLAMAHTLSSLTLVAMLDFEGARREVEAALRLAEEAGNAGVHASALYVLATMDVMRGRSTEALVPLRQATGLMFQMGLVGGLDGCARLARKLPEDIPIERDVLIAEIELQIASLRAEPSPADQVGLAARSEPSPGGCAAEASDLSDRSARSARREF